MTRLQRDHLETLLAAVDLGTFDAAARALSITPSAVSQRIRAMEQQVGRVLVQRTTPIEPTTDGEVVLRHARQVRLLDDETSRALDLDSSATVPSIPLALNADTLGTWFLDALALVFADTAVVFDLHREDQDRTAELLRAGAVMAAVTAEREPVQGCSSVLLGVDRYRAVASPAFVERHLAGSGDDPERRMLRRLDGVPLVDYDRDDDLQQSYLRRVLGHAPRAPRHFVPTSADFARAVRLGFGWGMLPEAQCLDDLHAGALVELTPGRRADVALYWQCWNLSSPLLDLVTDAVRATAGRVLHQPPVD